MGACPPTPMARLQRHITGDTLQAIARAASVWQREVTVKEILEANPGLESSLRVGQKLMIPRPEEKQ